jgi:ABC-type transporter MlaC component
MKQFFINNQKNLLIALVLFVVVVIAFVVYRMFFEFKAKDVKEYIKDEADKYKGDEVTAYAIIQDGVQHILSSHNLTQLVLRSAKQSGTPKEQELVHASIMQARSYGYIE